MYLKKNTINKRAKYPKNQLSNKYMAINNASIYTSRYLKDMSHLSNN